MADLDHIESGLLAYRSQSEAWRSMKLIREVERRTAVSLMARHNCKSDPPRPRRKR
jgi:hypothetical protein